MKKRTLTPGLAVSAIGYGAMGLSEFYGATNDRDSLQLLSQLRDLDITFIDTADLYGRGHNEQLIGQFLAGLSQAERLAFTVATKCGIERPADEPYARTINNQPDYPQLSCVPETTGRRAYRSLLSASHQCDDAD